MDDGDREQADGARQQAQARGSVLRPSRAATAGSANEKAKQTAEYIAKQLPPHSMPCVVGAASRAAPPKTFRATATPK